MMSAVAERHRDSSGAVRIGKATTTNLSWLLLVLALHMTQVAAEKGLVIFLAL
jgi:hypothetical protein